MQRIWYQLKHHDPGHVSVQSKWPKWPKWHSIRTAMCCQWIGLIQATYCFYCCYLLRVIAWIGCPSWLRGFDSHHPLHFSFYSLCQY